MINIVGSFCKQVAGCAVTSMIAVVAVGFCTTPIHAQQISFNQVLAAPDDLELNLAYARQQIASGSLQQAASALERLLLLRPNWDSARLLYGIVLYRLDDLTGADRELSLLEGRGLNAVDERSRVRYLALARKRLSPLRVSARLSLGARIDSNIDNAPDDPTLDFAVNEEFGTAVTASGQIRVELDVGTSGNYLFLQTNDHINERFDSDTADSATTRAHLGMVLHGTGFIVTPHFIYGTSWLQHERFRQSYGGGLDTRWSLNPQTELLLNGRAVYEDYRTTDYSSIGDLRDGWRTSVESGIKYRLTDAQTFHIKGRVARKEAESDGFSYDEGLLSINSLTLLGKGRYLSLSAYYKKTEYDEPTEFVDAGIARKDDLFYARAAIGAPLATLFSGAKIDLPASVGDVVAQFGVSYRRQNSNIDVLEHDNWSADIMFAKRFQF